MLHYIKLPVHISLNSLDFLVLNKPFIAQNSYFVPFANSQTDHSFTGCFKDIDKHEHAVNEMRISSGTVWVVND